MGWAKIGFVCGALLFPGGVVAGVLLPMGPSAGFGFIVVVVVCDIFAYGLLVLSLWRGITAVVQKGRKH
jgi:hypothetical protein